MELNSQQEQQTQESPIANTVSQDQTQDQTQVEPSVIKSPIIDLAPFSKPRVEDGKPVGPALLAARNRTIQEYQNARLIANRLGVPRGWVLEDPERAQHKLTLKTLSRNDQLLQWAAESPEKAANAKENAGLFADLADTLEKTYTHGKATYNIHEAIYQHSVEARQFREARRRGELTPEQIAETSKRLNERKQALELSAQAVRMNPDKGLLAAPGADMAMSQLPRMWNEDIPTTYGYAAVAAIPGALYGMAQGALAGPGAWYTVPLATLHGAYRTGVLGYYAGSAKAAYRTESDYFFTDLMAMKDKDGKEIPFEVQDAAADIYGFASGLVEVAGDKIFNTIVKPLELLKGAGTFSKEWFKEGMKKALRNAIAKKAFRSRLVEFASKLGKVSIVEGAEEGIQTILELLTANWAKAEANAEHGTNFETGDLLNEKNAERVWTAVKEGFLSTPWLVSPRLAGHMALNGMIQSYATNKLVKDQTAIREVVEKLSASGNVDPVVLQDFIEQFPAMNQQVALPADALMELYQKGQDLITPLGFTADQVEKAAAQGHDMLTKASDLQTWLDRPQFDAAMQIARPDISGKNSIEAARTEAETLEVAKRMAELVQNREKVLTEMDAELERFKAELVNLANGNPNLLSQMQAVEGDAKTAIDRLLELHRAFAIRMSSAGQNPLDLLRRTTADQIRHARRVNQSLAQNIDDDLTPNIPIGAKPMPIPAPAPMAEPTAQPAAAQQPAPAPQVSFTPQEDGTEYTTNAYSMRSPNGNGQARVRTNKATGQIDVILEIEGKEPEYRNVPAEQAQGKTEHQLVQELLAEYQPEEIQFTGEVLPEQPAEEQATEQLYSERGNPVGKGTVILGTSDQAHYEVWEADDLIPSHDPLANFAPRDDYPEGAQERQYQSDPAEQQKVRDNASQFTPNEVINNAPNPLTGPPIITRDGVVMGGNSRAMTIQIVYSASNSTERMVEGLSRQKVTDFRQAMIDNAAIFGIEPAAIEAMRKPVLVRVVDEDLTEQEVRERSRKYNQALTQEMQTEAEGLSRSNSISEATLALFATELEDFDSLAEYLNSDRSSRLLEALLKDGVITAQERNNLTQTNDTARLNDRGKSVVTAALRGLIVPDYELLKGLEGDLLKAVDRIIPAMARLRARGGKWDLTGVLAAALREIQTAKANGKPLEVWLYQGDLTGKNPDRNKPAVQALALMLDAVPKKKVTQREVQTRFNYFADMAAKEQPSLLGPKKGVEADAFVAAFLTPVARVGQETIANFDPANSPAHEAIQWAAENGGQNGKVSVATRKLDDILKSTEYTEEGKQKARERQKHLADLDGDATIAVYQPSLGQSFGYRKGQELWQTREGMERKPDSETVKVEKIPENAVPEFTSMGDLSAWIRNTLSLQGKIVINSTNQSVQFTNTNVNASLKRSRIKEHRQAYAALKRMINNAEYERTEQADERHPHTNGQDVYLSGLFIGNNFYTVKIKLDIVPETTRMRTVAQGMKAENLRYKDHKVTKIEIAPALYRGTYPTQQADAINEVTLGVLRQNVKPSIIENQTLYQTEGQHLGSTQVYDTPNGPEFLISLFDGANLSTLLHETGHIFYEEMERVVLSGAGDATMRQDYQTLREWVGAEEGVPLTVEQREQIARGFEAYLMEGKAPTRQLEGAFARFKRWLMNIYKSIADLNVNLTDEVRGVFDRMISTEQEMATEAMQNQLLDLTQAELDALGLTGLQRDTAAGLMDKARAEATESLQRARDINRRERRRTYIAEATEEVDNDPLYKALEAVKGKPINLEYVADEYGDKIANRLYRKFKGTFDSNGTTDPEALAAELGISVDDLILGLDKMPTKMKDRGKAIRELTRQKEAAHDEKHDALGYLLDSKPLAAQMQLIGRRLADLLNTRHVPQSAYRRVVEQELGNKPMREAVSTAYYLAAAKRALTAMHSALNVGDIATAMESHRKAMLNLEYARATRNLGKQVDKIKNRIKKFLGNKKADKNAKALVMHIAMQHSLGRHKKDLDRYDPGKWLAEAQGQGYNLFATNEMINQGRDYRTLTVAEFNQLADAISQIIKVESNQRKLLVAGKKQAVDDAADQLIELLKPRKTVGPGNVVEDDVQIVLGLRGADAALRKVEALCMILDGGKHGPFWNLIYRPINKAEDKKMVKIEEAKKAITKLFTMLDKDTRKNIGRKEVVEEVGAKLTWADRLCVALNLGNKINIDRLQVGNRWTAEQIAAVVKPLTSTDWKFVQAVWDYFETFKEESFALHEKITGVRPKEVEAVPFTVKTADGVTMQMRGGYYPIRYKNRLPFAFRAKTDAALVQELFGGYSFMFAFTEQGHLKERGPKGLEQPIKLSLDVITDHIFNVIHDLAYREAVMDVAKLLRHKGLEAEMNRALGPAMQDAFYSWLVNVSREHKDPMTYIELVAAKLRTGVSMATMGIKVTTIMTQLAGITNTIRVLGFGYTARGVLETYGNWNWANKARKQVFTKSVFMRNRISTFDREVKDMVRRLMPNGRVDEMMQKWRDLAFVPMGVFQLGVDLPTWWGAYRKALDEGKTDAWAVEYADSIVRLTQASGATKDLAKIQRGGHLLRLFTFYYTPFNGLYNLAAMDIDSVKQGRHNWFYLASTALWLWFVPAVLAELLALRAPEDDEDWLKWMARFWAQYPFQTIPVVRDLASWIFNRFDYKITPAQSAPEAVGSTVINAWDAVFNDKDPKKMVKPAVQALGYIFGLPSAQAYITIGNIYDYITGHTSDFQVRDLLVAKQKDRR